MNVISIITREGGSDFNRLVRRIVKLVSTSFVSTDKKYCVGGGSSKQIIVHTSRSVEEFKEWLTVHKFHFYQDKIKSLDVWEK